MLLLEGNNTLAKSVFYVCVSICLLNINKFIFVIF